MRALDVMYKNWSGTDMTRHKLPHIHIHTKRGREMNECLAPMHATCATFLLSSRERERERERETHVCVCARALVQLTEGEVAKLIHRRCFAHSSAQKGRPRQSSIAGLHLRRAHVQSPLHSESANHHSSPSPSPLRHRHGPRREEHLL